MRHGSNIFMSWPACCIVSELFYFYFKILGEDSDLIQPNYHYGMIHYALSGLFGIFWPKMGRMCSLGGIGALFFFSYAMYDIGALCIACIIGKVQHVMALFPEYQRYMLHDLYPLWDLIVINWTISKVTLWIYCSFILILSNQKRRRSSPNNQSECRIEKLK